MMNTLTIDIGNTNQSFRLFQDADTLLAQGDLNSLPKKFDIKTTIISCVNDDNLKKIKARFIRPKDFLKYEKLLDMPVRYESSIGEDRLVCAYYLFKTSSLPIVLIDTGSFTTIDLITICGFQGGHILPGLKKLEEVYHQGKNLRGKHLHSNSMIKNELPRSTTKAIEQGVLHSFIAPIKEILAQINETNIIITGGNAKVLYNLLGVECITLDSELIHKALLFFGKQVSV